MRVISEGNFMDSGRMPVRDIVPLPGEDIANGLNNITSGDNIKVLQPMQEPNSIFGNKCGHNKNKIKVPAVFGKTKSGARLPHAISECGTRLQYLADRIRRGISRDDIEAEKANSSRMFRWYMSLYDDPRFMRFLYHPANNRRGRKRRSESLESALFITMGTIISRLNLYQMAYGFSNNRNEFVYFDYARIAKEGNISLIRVKRAMKILQTIGFFKVVSIIKTLHDGKKINVATQIHATDMVFDFLGLMPEFLADRETSAIKFHEKQSRLNKNQIYRKPNFPKKPTKVDKDIVKGCQSIANKMSIMPVYKDNGHGRAVRDRINDLVRRGMSIPDAMKAVREGKPPPS